MTEESLLAQAAPWAICIVAFWAITQAHRFVFPSLLAPKPSTTLSRGLNMALCVSVALTAAALRLTPYLGAPTLGGYLFAGFSLGCAVTFGHLAISRTVKVALRALRERGLRKLAGQPAPKVDPDV